MQIKLSINIEIRNPWKLIVLGQVAVKAFKLMRAQHRARKIGKQKINTEVLAKYDDL